MAAWESTGAHHEPQIYCQKSLIAKDVITTMHIGTCLGKGMGILMQIFCLKPLPIIIPMASTFGTFRFTEIL